MRPYERQKEGSDSSMEKWEDQLKKYYTQHALPESKAKRLLARAEYARPSWRTRPLTSVSLAVAAMLLFGTALLWVWVGRAPNMADRVATAIVTIHQLGLDLEVVTDSYDTLQTRLDQLTFPLRPTEDVLQNHFELVGGRYCYLLGQLSAQLKLKKAHSDAVYTLYVTPATPETIPAAGHSIEYDGLEVSIWQDQDRIFGLAGTAPLEL